MQVYLEGKLNRHDEFALVLVGCHVAVGLGNFC
jgi:hypothetical protein